MLHVPSMEGLGVVGGDVPQSFQGETTVASKGVAAFVFMAFSVHECHDHDHEQGVAKRLTSRASTTLS